MLLLFYRWDPERSKNLSHASQEAVQNQKLSSHPPSFKHTPLILLRWKYRRKPLSHSQEHHRIYTHSFSLVELQHFHFFVCLFECYPSLVIISSPFFLGLQPVSHHSADENFIWNKRRSVKSAKHTLFFSFFFFNIKAVPDWALQKETSSIWINIVLPFIELDPSSLSDDNCAFLFSLINPYFSLLSQPPLCR